MVSQSSENQSAVLLTMLMKRAIKKKRSFNWKDVIRATDDLIFHLEKNLEGNVSRNWLSVQVNLVIPQPVF